VRGLIAMRKALEYLGLPYVIFGPDTPVTVVAEYAARLACALQSGALLRDALTPREPAGAASPQGPGEEDRHESA
jgi:hypothetical protein